METARNIFFLKSVTNAKKVLDFSENHAKLNSTLAKKEKTMFYGSTQQNVNSSAVFALMPYAVFAPIITIAIINIIIR